MLTLLREANPARCPPSRRRVRRWRVTGAIAICMAAGVSTLSWFSNPLLTAALVRAPNHGKSALPLTPVDELARRGIAHAFRLPGSSPGIVLSVWVMEPAARPRGTVLLLHGMYDNKRSQLGLAKTFTTQGYQAILVDLRGHGESTGDWLTYGALDVPDLRGVLDQLDERGLLSGPTGVFGSSYGAAVGIQLAHADARVRAVVAVGTYASVRQAATDSILATPLAREFTAGEIEQALADAGRIGGFNAGVCSPEQALAAMETPVLLIHGEGDGCVPIMQAEANLRAGAGHTELLRIPDAGHFAVFRDRSGRMSSATLEWFERWLGTTP